MQWRKNHDGNPKYESHSNRLYRFCNITTSLTSIDVLPNPPSLLPNLPEPDDHEYIESEDGNDCPHLEQNLIDVAVRHPGSALCDTAGQMYVASVIRTGANLFFCVAGRVPGLKQRFRIKMISNIFLCLLYIDKSSFQLVSQLLG